MSGPVNRRDAVLLPRRSKMAGRHGVHHHDQRVVHPAGPLHRPEHLPDRAEDRQAHVRHWLICTTVALSIVVAAEVHKAVLGRTAASPGMQVSR
jgi:hypothetical protein